MLLPGGIEDPEADGASPFGSSCDGGSGTPLAGPPMARSGTKSDYRTVSTDLGNEPMDENMPLGRSNTGWMSVVSSAWSEDGQSESEASAARGAEMTLTRTEMSKQEKPRLKAAQRSEEEERHLEPHKDARQMDAGTRTVVAGAVASNRFCAKLRQEELDAIVDSMVCFHFEPGSAIIRADESGSYFFVIQDGVLEVLVDGAVSNTLLAGSSFGGIALLYNCPRTATVLATSPSTLWAVHCEVFRRVIHEWCSKRCAENRRLLDSVSLLDGLTLAQKDRIGELALMEQELQAGDVVVEKGDPVSSILCVKSGALAVWEGATVSAARAVEGGSKTATLGAGGCFGERAALCGEPSSVTVVAEGHTEVVCIGVPQLREVAGEDLAQCLQRSFLRAALKKVSAFARLPMPQQARLADVMMVKTYGPGRAIVADAMLLVVVDGTVTASDCTLERGDFWQDEKLTHADGKAAQEPQAPQGRGLAGLRSGRGGCKVAVLLSQAASKALQGITPSRPVEGGGPGADFVRRVLLARKAPIFRELSEDQINKLAGLLVLKAYEQGTAVFEQGQAGQAYYIVSAGEVLVSISGRQVRTLRSGTCFGERSLLVDEPRNATVEVSSQKAELWCLSREHFESVVPPEMRKELARRVLMQDSTITLKSLRHIRIIGAGSFGSVRLVQHRRIDTRYALKRVKKKEGVVATEVRRECSLLAELDHPFIMKLVKTFETKHSVYILTELITGGELFMHTNKKMGALTRPQTQFYAGTLVMILEHLHDRGIVYRDLKPENVMLDAQGYLKLVDFGFAKKLDPTTMRTYSLVGTLLYLAPELIQGNGYGTSVDVWSLGVMIYELAIGRLPFGEGRKTEHDILVAVLEEPLRFPTKYTDSAGKKLIQAMLSRQPEHRLGAKSWDEVKRNKYFKAGVSGNLFERILGRELDPPVVPKGDEFAGDDAHAALSDADELGGGEDVIIARVLDVFQRVKLSNDRKLSKQQLGKVLRVLDSEKFSEEAMTRIWTAMGIEQDARVRLDHFLSWMSLGDGEAFSRAIALDDIHA